MNIPSFSVLKDELNQRWLDYLEKNHQANSPSEINGLTNYNVDHAYIKGSEVAAALRFINYANHFELPDMIID